MNGKSFEGRQWFNFRETWNKVSLHNNKNFSRKLFPLTRKKSPPKKCIIENVSKCGRHSLYDIFHTIYKLVNNMLTPYSWRWYKGHPNGKQTNEKNSHNDVVVDDDKTTSFITFSNISNNNNEIDYYLVAAYWISLPYILDLIYIQMTAYQSLSGIYGNLVIMPI